MSKDTAPTLANSEVSNETDQRKILEKEFTEKLIKYGRFALGIIPTKDTKGSYIDYVDCTKEKTASLVALNAEGALQQMLVSQMVAIHTLQQIAMAMANKLTQIENKRFYTNSAIKLANTFIQQATLLNKLQGNCAQKITVERVDIRDGGQAIVGNIAGVLPKKEK